MSNQIHRNYRLNNFDGKLIQPNPTLFAQAEPFNGQTSKNIPRPWAPGILVSNLASDPSIMSIVSGPSRTLSPELTPIFDGSRLRILARALEPPAPAATTSVEEKAPLERDVSIEIY